MNKVKQEIPMTRAEAVQRIQALLEQLQKGSVVLGDKTFPIPEQLLLELEADDEEFEIELKWRPPAAEGQELLNP